METIFFQKSLKGGTSSLDNEVKGKIGEFDQTVLTFFSVSMLQHSANLGRHFGNHIFQNLKSCYSLTQYCEIMKDQVEFDKKKSSFIH